MLKIPFKITETFPSDMPAEKVHQRLKLSLRYKFFGVRFVISDDDYRIFNK